MDSSNAASPAGAGSEGDSGLTPGAFESLLGRLGSDREQGAERYEIIRRKLIRLFAWRGCRLPEELADETLNRVAFKLEGGLEIQSEDPYRYICGVAWRVFQEKIRERARQTHLQQEYGLELRRLPPRSPEESQTGANPLAFCFRHCLGSVAEEDRDLILRYYDGEKSERIRRRRLLADETGLQLNNLRVRAYRIRHRLEQCTGRCVDRSSGEDHATA